MIICDYKDTLARNGVDTKISEIRRTGVAYRKIEAIFMYTPRNCLNDIDGPADTHVTGTILALSLARAAEAPPNHLA